MTLPVGKVVWMAGTTGFRRAAGPDSLVVAFAGSAQAGGGWGRLIFNDPFWSTLTAKIAQFQYNDLTLEKYSEDEERSYQLPVRWFAGRPQLDVTLKRFYDPKDWVSEKERAQLARTKGIGSIAYWRKSRTGRWPKGRCRKTRSNGG